MTPSAKWVMDYLQAAESLGAHAPVETMQRVADSQDELLAVLEALLDILEQDGFATQMMEDARVAIARAQE